MSRFLFAPIPVTGHVNPGLPIAAELVRRGHEVVWYSTPRFQKAIEQAGARFVPVTEGFLYDEEKLDEQVPERAKLKGLSQLKFDMKVAFIDTVPGSLRDLEKILAGEQIDVVVADSMAGAPGLLAERHGIPWAVYGISVFTLSSRDTAPFGLGIMPSQSPLGRLRNRFLNWMVENVVFKDVFEHYRKVRASLGFEPSPQGIFDFSRKADVYLQSSIEAFEYPRTDLPDKVRFIGSFVPQPPADWTPPGWWNELESGKPVVLVTQGTIANDYDQLIRPAIRALADEDVLVIVTTGSKPVEDVGIDALPSNVRVERFVPYAHLMPRVDMLLTNGGFGSVQIALTHGVPIVAFGASEDKAEIANRIAWSGVGIGVRSNTPKEGQIYSAVQKVLNDPSYRARAEEMQRELSTYDAAMTAGNLLEDLAPRPVRQKVYAA